MIDKGSDYYQILGVKKAATSAEIKTAYHDLARKYHPDANKDPSAESIFKDITVAYKALMDADTRKHYDTHGRTNPVILTSKNAKYDVGSLVFAGDIADIYKGHQLGSGQTVALKIVRDAANSDLLKNEWDMLKQVRPVDADERKYNRYFSQPIETFKVDDGNSRRQVNVLGWLEHWWSFDQIRSAFHNQLQMNHGVWMFNRLLGGLGYIHNTKGVVHGAITPDHVLAYTANKENDPMNHGVKLLDWCYAVKIGEKVAAIVPKYRDCYPPEILGKQAVTPATDIYMAAKTVIHVLGGDIKSTMMPAHVPEYLANFLKGCCLQNPASRPQDAWELHKEFKEHMKLHYGPRQYVRFDMPIMG